MLENAIEVKNLSICYRSLKSYSIKKMLLERKNNKKDLFCAVDDVSFEVPKGEIWGIIGKNGSGKSTLLKAVAGIFSPDTGIIDLKNHSVSLLAIGIGFNVALSGTENIMLLGLLLGFSEDEIKEKLAEIVEFSELGDFIDKPVRTYSSGMYSKLSFSIAAILETEILLIDEVLSVGDERFKKKSMNKMKELINQKDRTVMIVSHSIPTLKELCSKVIWMDSGKIKMLGDTEEVLNAYQEYMK